MLDVLVLILYANVASCISPEMADMATPMKQFNEACGYDACPTPMSVDGINVHIVPHTHYELAFQRTFAEHYTGEDRVFMKSEINMKRTLDTVITELWMQPYRRFAFSDIPYFFHWWSQRDDTVRQMVYTLIRQGRLVFIGGGWSMNDEATTNYHAIIDSFTYSLRKINATFLECGRPLVAWQADVAGHSREFASLAAQMGYDALFINPISFDDELARMRRWALEMVWRGSDDLGPKSDIFTHKLFDGYWTPPGFCFSALCKDPLIITSDSIFTNKEQRAKEFMDSIYNRQAPNYNSSHVMVIMGRMLGYFDAPMWFSNIDALINIVNERGFRGKQKMYLMYSTPACYAKAVREANTPLETKQDDFFPVAYDKTSYLTGFFTSFPSIKLMAKEVMVYLQMCKQMQIFAELGSYYSKIFEELNWITGVFQDHNVISGSMIDYIKSYYVQKMYIAVQRSTLLLKQAWNKLRKAPTDTIYYRCSFNASRCHQLVGETYFLQIYNTLAWPVSMPVRMPMQCSGEDFIVYDPRGKSVTSAVIRIPYPVLNIHSRVNVSNVEIVFIAENIPAIGFKSYFIQRIINGTREGEEAEEERDVTKEVKRHTERKRRIKRTIIKKMRRKPNKKYLIRQVSPQMEDQTLLYNLDYEDDESTSMNPLLQNDNVSVLLESDIDEFKMQQFSDTDDEANTEIQVDEETMTSSVKPLNQTNEHTLVLKINTVPLETETVTEATVNITTANMNVTIKPKLWNKVAMKNILAHRRMNEFDSTVRNMVPVRTTTSKYKVMRTSTSSTIEQDSAITDITESTEIMKEESKEQSKEDKEGLGDIAQSILENVQMKTEADVNAEESVEATAEAVKATTEAFVEVTETQINITTTTSPDDVVDVTPNGIQAEQSSRKQLDEDIQPEPQKKPVERKKLNNTFIENKLDEDIQQEPQKKPVEKKKLNNTFIENKYIRISISPLSNKISVVTLSNGVHMDLDIQFYYYPSDDPVALGKQGFKKPGSLLFRAMENKATPILDFVDTQIVKTSVVEEAHLVYSDWTSFVIRVYAESPVIEVEWLVGPIPVDDKLGKEVFVRYLTNIIHDGIFYTDSNGRQTIKRIRNLRPMFETLNMDQIAGNYYPVTSKISIEDLNTDIRFSVFTDRAQGGTSLSDGELDLMLSRRILTDDTGIGTFVNDTEYGKGAVVRGKHYLYISKVTHKPHRIFEKKFAKEIQSGPQVLVSRPDPYGEESKSIWYNSVNEMSFLKTKLPIGIHILTIEDWNDGTLLLRLENYLEKADTKRSQVKTVFPREMFTNIYINSMKETTLAANVWLEDYKKKSWNKNENFVKNFNEFYGSDEKVEFVKDEPEEAFEEVDLDKGVKLSPQQIRTFVCWYDYVEV